ncbi:HemK family protein methyltransferase, partial [Neisseria sp. P0013.S004]|uniref:HemK family protein methyltransferase n=1 Tax=Neisseria sp. P0013.S004 TaxID=3436740 RepID=UPI003F8212C4
TGSGSIAVTVARERVDAGVRASDISTGALDTARQHAAELGAKVEFAQGSWFDTDRSSEGRYDVIVSNPPYIENGDEHLSQGDVRFEPQNALTDCSDCLSHIRHITQEAPKYLKANCWLLVEHCYDQGEAVRNIMLKNGFAEVATEQELAGLEGVT